jgi:hypothetical protein
MIDEHINTFIQTNRCRWDFSRLIFDRDLIYDIEGSPQEKGFELSSSEDYFSCVYDSDVWQLDSDMITDLLEDDQSQHFHDDFQSSLGTCDAYLFGDADLLYEDSHPLLDGFGLPNRTFMTPLPYLNLVNCIGSLSICLI